MGSDGLKHNGHEHQLVHETLLGDAVLSPQEGRQENFRTLFPEIIGKSEAIAAVMNLAAKVAKSNSSVLLLGESGTGKELIASAIHRLSERSHNCFVAINCSAIPEELLEAELFGHEKGAFTGADRKRIGYFGVADQGTIFLDEIGDMPPRLQAKLLRVLQEKKYTPVGSNAVHKVDVRIIAATNKDLELAVQAQTFRLDLFYRLNVFPIKLPPLCERKDDIALLLEYFCEQMDWLHPHHHSSWFTPEAIDVLANYRWPGNVRQLQNLVERVVITKGGGRIHIEDLPSEVTCEIVKDVHEDKIFPLAKNHIANHSKAVFPENFGKLPQEGFDLNRFISDLENAFIVQALERTNNNKNQAAKLLGLNRTTLVEKIKKRKISLFVNKIFVPYQEEILSETDEE